MITQADFIAARRRLRSAVTSKDPERILRTVSQARALFESEGFPDSWGDWRRAAEDAAARCRVEGTRDYLNRDRLDDVADRLEREALAWW